MFINLCEYVESETKSWNEFPNRVDAKYELRTKIIQDKKRINVYKVGVMSRIDKEPIWNFLIGVEFSNDRFIVDFFLDVEDEIIESLIKKGYTYRTNYWMKEFQIELSSLDEVKTLLQEHVWCYDPGYLY